MRIFLILFFRAYRVFFENKLNFSIKKPIEKNTQVKKGPFMAFSNTDTLDKLILKDDLYKDNTLLLKKGSVLNNYIINKLHKFGVKYATCINEENEITTQILTEYEVLIINNNQFKNIRTREVLKHAGYENENILFLNSCENILLKKNLLKDIKFIFIDYALYNKDFLNELYLIKNNKIKIFITDVPEINNKRFLHNSDFQDIVFLQRPLANNYINALLRLYS